MINHKKKITAPEKKSTTKKKQRGRHFLSMLFLSSAKPRKFLYLERNRFWNYCVITFVLDVSIKKRVWINYQSTFVTVFIIRILSSLKELRKRAQYWMSNSIWSETACLLRILNTSLSKEITLFYVRWQITVLTVIFSFTLLTC